MKRTLTMIGLILAACGGSGTTSDPAPDAGATADPGGPQLLSFGTNVTTLKQTTNSPPDMRDSITFVAVVTHPQGVADLVGGHLTDSTGAIQYGAFIASQQGSYSLSLAWDQIYQATEFQFTGQTQLGFTASFYDVQGRKAATTTNITLACPVSTDVTCSSACSDLQTDGFNCGSCGHVCPGAGYSNVCMNGACAP